MNNFLMLAFLCIFCKSKLILTESCDNSKASDIKLLQYTFKYFK